MLYHSTRSRNEAVGSKEAILKGLCPDGGLYVSDAILNTHLDMKKLLSLSYEEIVFEVFRLLLNDYTERELKDSIASAYRGKFDSKELTPLTKIGDKYLLELYHGPTLAFKDLALCMLPQLMSKALGKNKVMILTATSGDTGKAALSGFKDANNIGIVVFFPYQKVSDLQYLQMVTQEGKNVSVAAVTGNFDDCQSAVKKIFEMCGEKFLREKRVSLSSANSINIGRLIPQIVYYIYAYKKLVDFKAVNFGDKVDFVVPTGNFGDILAGYYAKLLGLPVHKLIVASNENKVLTDFFKTGVYNKNRSFIKTISPSMDILLSSNLERMLYYASGCDSEYVKILMKSLSQTGRFEVNKEVFDFLNEIFDAGYSTNEESKEAIKDAYYLDGRLIDPHSAVGYKVARDLDLKRPTVILSTASPFKFAKDVYEAIFGKLNEKESVSDGFSYMEALSKETGLNAPRALIRLKELPIRHKKVLDVDEMEKFVYESLSLA